MFLYNRRLDLLIVISVAPKYSWSFGDFRLFLVEEDLTYTNIGISACMGRTTDALQVSWKIFPHESFCPDRDLNPRGEGFVKDH